MEGKRNKKSMSPDRDKNTEIEIKERVAQATATRISVLVIMMAACTIALGIFAMLFLKEKPVSTIKTPDQLWQDFKNSYGVNWDNEWQEVNGVKMPKTLKGDSIAVKNFSTYTSVAKDNIDAISKEFLQEQESLLKVDVNALEPYRTFSQPPLDSNLNKVQVIHYQQNYNNIPVHQALTTLSYNNDKLIFYKSSFYPDISVNTNPTLTKEEAFRRSKILEVSGYTIPTLFEGMPWSSIYESGFASGKKSFDSEFQREKVTVKEKDIKLELGSLEIYPVTDQGTTAYHLAWRLEFKLIKEPITKPVYYIDAHNGDLLAREDRIFYQVPVPDIYGTVTGLFYPYYPLCEFEQSPCDQAGSEVRSFTNEDVSVAELTVQTDEEGYYSFTGLSGEVFLNSELKGPFVDIDNLEQSEALHTADLTVPSLHDWNWQDEDTSYKKEESNVFYHVNVIHDYFIQGAPFDIYEMDYPMSAVVAEGGACNAYATGDEIHFLQEGEVWGWHCEATSLGSDIIYHEYTHNVTEHIYGPGVLEYFGESGAMHEGYSDYFAASILNRSTMGDGIFPETIRNLDNANHYPEDIIGEVHHDSLIFSGALWDTRARLGADITDALVVQTEKLFPLNFQEFLETLLLVDDNDGDIINGTPHITDICDSFVVNHGIWSDYCIGFMSVPTARINEPVNGSLFGETTIEIVGTAYPSFGENFQNYIIEYGRGIDPTEWQTEGITLYAGGAEPIRNQLLGSLDTSFLSFGGFTIRLTVYDESGSNFATVLITTGVRDNWPQSLGHFSTSSPTVADIDPHYPGREVLVTSWNHNLWAFHDDGTLVDGWPKDLELSVSYRSSLAVADIDPQNENGMEVVVGTVSRWPDWGTPKLFVVSANGEDVPGWPKVLGVGVEGSPTIVDLDNNLENGLEIVVAAESFIYAWHADGSLVLGWPQEIDIIITSPWAAPAVADLDLSYPGKEVVLYDNNSTAFVWHADGTVAEGWPVPIDYPSGSSAIADIDNNFSNGYEIITSYHSSVEVRAADGLMREGWPQGEGFAYNAHYSDVSIGEVDGIVDNGLEIVVGRRNNIHIWHQDGSFLSGWPVSLNADVTSSPLLVDLDSNSPGLEIIIAACNTSSGMVCYLFAWQADGSVMEGWPLAINQIIITTPVISDLDGDGTLELVINYSWGDMTEDSPYGPPIGSVVVFDLPYTNSASSAVLEWQKFHRDTRNTGFYNQCSDFTPFGECSTSKPKYCKNGKLSDQCVICGCLEGELCDRASGRCISTSHIRP